MLDIGSNSVRLVVYDGLHRSPLTLVNEKVLCGLGRGVAQNGVLNPQGVQEALQALERYAGIVGALGADPVLALGTAALRAAKDGPAFCERVARQHGIAIRVITGEEEAHYAATGVLSGIGHASGFVGDLGGGSLELIDIPALSKQVSLPLGPLVLQSVGAADSAAVKKHIKSALAKHKSQCGFKAGSTFYAVGGAWRNLAKLYMESVDYPLQVLHHYKVKSADFCRFIEQIIHADASAMAAIAEATGKRADTLPYAAAVLQGVVDSFAPKDIVFSAYGLREGVLYEQLAPAERRKDPLLAYAEKATHRYQQHAIVGALYDWISPLYPSETPAHKRLRRASCWLSDVSWAEHTSYRAEHAWQHILSMPVGGITHAERVFLALVQYVRYGGSLKKKWLAAYQNQLSATQNKDALVLGNALRLAYSLSAGAEPLLHAAELMRQPKSLALAVEAGRERWVNQAILRRFNALAELL